MFVVRKDDVVIEIRTGFEPFAITILGTCLAWSALTLAALGRATGATTNALPWWAVYFFFGAMLTGASVTIIGVILEKFYQRLYGFYVEAAGLGELFFLCLVYAWWVAVVVGAPGSGFILFMAGVAIASAWRVTLVILGLRKTKRYRS